MENNNQTIGTSFNRTPCELLSFFNFSFFANKERGLRADHCWTCPHAIERKKNSTPAFQNEEVVRRRVAMIFHPRLYNRSVPGQARLEQSEIIKRSIYVVGFCLTETRSYRIGSRLLSSSTSLYGHFRAVGRDSASMVLNATLHINTK